MRRFILGILFALLVCGQAATAPAYQVPLGDNGFEPSLQEVLDAHIAGGSINALADQRDAGVWHVTGSAFTVWSVSSYRGDSGTLGIRSNSNGHAYDLGFVGLTSSLLITVDGQLMVNNVLLDSSFGNWFGFYWRDTQPGNLLESFTDDGLNAAGKGYGPNNSLAVRYLLSDGLEVTTGKNLNGPVLSTAGGNDWILAFEDRPRGRGDGDFNDAVFYVENVVPAPEPGSVFLMLGGGVFLGAFVLRRRARG